MAAQTQVAVVDMAADYGIRPETGKNLSPAINRALADIKTRHTGKAVTLRFMPGRYDFHQKGSATREYYISITTRTIRNRWDWQLRIGTM